MDGETEERGTRGKEEVTDGRVEVYVGSRQRRLGCGVGGVKERKEGGEREGLRMNGKKGKGGEEKGSAGPLLEWADKRAVVQHTLG